MRLLAWLLISAAGFAVVRGQVGGGSNTLLADALEAANGVRRPGDGLYVPPGCSYVVDYYGQCGGNGTACNQASGVCADAQYPGGCCPAGFSCRRQNPQYWQCTPQTSYADTALVRLAPYAQCGGNLPLGSNLTLGSNGLFVGTQCPVGYDCQRLSASSSICTPNPFAGAEQAGIASPYMDILSQLASFTGAGRALAPGLQLYTFDAHSKGAAPPKPVDLVVNTTLIGEFLDGLLNRTATPPPPPSTIAPPPPAPIFNFTVPAITFQPPSPASIVGTDIVDAAGNIIAIHGFNWFGFETGDTMVQGLTPNFATPRDFSQTGDFATVVYRQQALGFNLVRLPFRFGDLNLAAKPITRPCTVDSVAQIKANLTNPTSPYFQINYANTAFPAQRSPPADGVAVSGICNSYLPSVSTLDRFLYVIQYYIGNGFYVAIDYHAGLGGIESDRQTVSNSLIFQQNWQALLTAIQSLPTYNDNIRGRIFFDLLNEPDGFNMTWSSPNINTRGQFVNSSTVPSWGSLYTSTASLLAQQEPALLFLVEGTGQSSQPGTAFGQGFGINPAIYNNQPGLYNALGGLQTLVANPAVRARTIISPHVYGGQITGWTRDNFGGNTDDSGLGLPFTYFNNWAYLSRVGVPPAAGGPNATFPVIIGEFGNVFNSSLNATTDEFSDSFTDQWIHDFAQFNNNLDPVNATAYPHSNFTNSIWWAWNGNQAQALGFVNADPGNVPANYNGPLSPGWLNIQWIKINNVTDVLNRNPYFTRAAAVASGGGFGLRPWYLPA